MSYILVSSVMSLAGFTFSCFSLGGGDFSPYSSNGHCSSVSVYRSVEARMQVSSEGLGTSGWILKQVSKDHLPALKNQKQSEGAPESLINRGQLE